MGSRLCVFAILKMGNKQSSGSGGGDGSSKGGGRFSLPLTGSKAAPSAPSSIKVVLERAQRSGVIQLNKAGVKDIPPQIAQVFIY